MSSHLQTCHWGHRRDKLRIPPSIAATWMAPGFTRPSEGVVFEDTCGMRTQTPIGSSPAIDEAPINSLPRFVWRWTCCRCIEKTVLSINLDTCRNCAHVRCYGCAIERVRVRLCDPGVVDFQWRRAFLRNEFRSKEFNTGRGGKGVGS